MHVCVVVGGGVSNSRYWATGVCVRSVLGSSSRPCEHLRVLCQRS
jgi:hypothetical protein